METTHRNLYQKMHDDANDATKPFSNAQNFYAVEINHAGDPDSRNYMCRHNEKHGGPNWDLISKDVEGPTSQNAGVFK